ncbi:arsenate reductase [Pseudoruegeria sp. SK021]|nr:ArsC/Spx/MgsR family protein [Pseudoruegeria sp. SK021]OSP54291.1 arsenate reductase [Pseudoruegeria sp. SK021]
MTLVGLKTCDTCRKARKALTEAGHDVTFQDVRETPPTVDDLAGWLEAFGSDLVNRKSTTWRGLSEAERACPPLAQLQAHPALMKRPVLAADGALYLGWGPETQAALLG